jgi:NADH:ubiquinone oxidoreductase subunit F (NADH-binding)
MGAPFRYAERAAHRLLARRLDGRIEAMKGLPATATATAVLERRLEPPRSSAGARTLPRVLLGAHADGAPLTLDEHVAAHGELAVERERRDRRETPALIEQIERAGLRGHGGAGFPTATKMRAVASRRGRAIVVVNAAEGEPASAKDRTLCRLAPHLMLDGAQAAAHAVGADEAIVAVCESAHASVEALACAIDERRALGGATLQLRATPNGYVAGQESALVNHLSGGPALPTFSPPLPFEQGLKRRPTLVGNAETYAHVALIARHGASWFRALGTAAQPGSALVTLSGPVASEAVYEIEHGARLDALIDAAGGLTAPIRAVLLGGYAGTWIDGEHARALVLCDERLAAHGATLGAGVVALLSERACPVAETARVARWLSRESAGQCGPCVHGLDALAACVAEIAAGAAGAECMRRVERLTRLVSRRGACAHPDGAARFLRSALVAFARELADHARHGRCDACARPAELPLPAHARTSPLGRRQAVAR